VGETKINGKETYVLEKSFDFVFDLLALKSRVPGKVPIKGNKIEGMFWLEGRIV